MVRTDTKLALAALAIASGSLDVSAFLRLGGVFASIMTSNLIFISLAVAKADATLVQHCAAALVSYVAAVGAGSALAPPSGRDSRLRSRHLGLLLTGEAVLLTGCAAWWMADGAHPESWQQLTLLGGVVFAMGLQAAATRELGDPDAGTTYMTGTLTAMVANAIAGRRPDPGAILAIGGMLAGAAIAVALLRTLPDVTPFLAVAAVTFTAALSWREHRRISNPTATPA